MIYSLSEIDAQAKKATRGAGFGWGHAEEAGKAARLLAACQLPGVTVLAVYLQRRAGDRSVFSEPLMAGNNWQPTHEGKQLCPLLSGACLCDYRKLVATEALVLEKVAAPLLLLPYVLRLSRECEQTLELSWTGAKLLCHAGRFEIAEDAGLAIEMADAVRCVPVTVDGEGQLPGNLGQDIPAVDWQILDQFAQLTYVPASEASRRGAGPGE